MSVSVLGVKGLACGFNGKITLYHAWDLNQWPSNHSYGVLSCWVSYHPHIKVFFFTLTALLFKLWMLSAVGICNSTQSFMVKNITNSATCSLIRIFIELRCTHQPKWICHLSWLICIGRVIVALGETRLYSLSQTNPLLLAGYVVTW